FKYHFKQALEASKIDHCRFHDTRHTFASHLAMSGVDLLTIKKLMRHKTMAMTLRYAHLSDQHTKKAVEQLSFETPKKESKEAL
ncbi:MAG TPA: tyrosine-type recombinase/integrase, partial [Acidobacteriota bacterium]|nr:tyrosine-type recombinase/integrase [Acidobacteriota bacterium]